MILTDLLKNPYLIFFISVWSIFWKISALWKTSRNNQFIWFIFIFFVNTLGILEIIYIKYFQKPGKEIDIKSTLNYIKGNKITKNILKFQRRINK